MDIENILDNFINYDILFITMCIMILIHYIFPNNFVLEKKNN